MYVENIEMRREKIPVRISSKKTMDTCADWIQINKVTTSPRIQKTNRDLIKKGQVLIARWYHYSATHYICCIQ